LRIDHFLLNAEAKKRFKNAGIDKWVRGQTGASDHAPVWIKLE
jgi:exodeoxyribonuclease-3